MSRRDTIAKPAWRVHAYNAAGALAYESCILKDSGQAGAHFDATKGHYPRTVLEHRAEGAQRFVTIATAETKIRLEPEPEQVNH